MITGTLSIPFWLGLGWVVMETVTVANGRGLALLFVPIEQIVRSFVTPLVLAQRGARAAIEWPGSAYDRRSWKARAVYR